MELVLPAVEVMAAGTLSASDREPNQPEYGGCDSGNPERMDRTSRAEEQ